MDGRLSVVANNQADDYGTCNYPFASANGLTEAQVVDRFNEILATGMGWMRTDFLWDGIEPTTKGQFVWTGYDKVVSAANTAGIKLLANLCYSVGWANGGQGTRVPPTDSQDFADFCAAVAARYYPLGVTHYEIINEANYKAFFPLDQGATTPASIDKYADMLQKSYTAIKAVVPGATVLMTGMAPAGPPGGFRVQEFLQGLYDRGCKGYFDVVNHHPYDWFLPNGHRAAHNQIYDIRQIMITNGDAAKKIWFTEFGRPTGGDGNFSTEQEQAEQLTKAIRAMRKLGYVEKMFVYNFKDSRSPDDTEDREHHFGIVRWDGTKKPAWVAVRHTIRYG